MCAIFAHRVSTKMIIVPTKLRGCSFTTTATAKASILSLEENFPAVAAAVDEARKICTRRITEGLLPAVVRNLALPPINNNVEEENSEKIIIPRATTREARLR